MEERGGSAHVKLEKERARELRKSRWWQTVCANARCYYCDKPIAHADVTMDHVVPLSQGGYSTPGNVAACCKACNTAKSDMTAVEWALRLAAAPHHQDL